jgi:4-amino-4-deoxy-L-arabinose transferase-like glycosyltransferase
MGRRITASSLSNWLGFVGPLALYVATLAPGVVYWDTGEMQTVPYILGIPHPTGFPLFVLGGWLFSHTFVLGNPAWRLSLFSALASAGACWLLAMLVRDVTRSALTGLAAALAFSLGTIVWTRAVRAEVHDVALFCTALAIAAAYRAGQTRSGRALGVAALGCGLGLATHPVTVFALPCVLVLAWPAIAAGNRRDLARALAALVVPLALYLYFPLRSAYVEAHGLDANVDLGLPGSALIDDGMPSSPASFWRYVTGQAFRPGLVLGSLARPEGIVRAFTFWHDALFVEFSFDMIVLAAVGFVYLAIVQRRLAVGFATLLVATGAFASNYAVETDSARYALPSFWILVACAGCGAHYIVSLIVGARPQLAAGLTVAMLAIALYPNAGLAYSDVVRANAFNDARSLGSDIARRTADGSLIVATWNYATPLAYASYVAGALGSRRLLCGWPPDYALDYDSWHKRFKHVYFVVNAKFDVSEFARPLLSAQRWQLSELR